MSWLRFQAIYASQDSAAITATLSVTLGAATLSATATKGTTASLSVTLADATLSATATKGTTGSLSATLADATLASAATKGTTASFAVTLAAATLSSAGTVGSGITASLSVTLAAATLSAAATKGTTGSLSATLAAATLSATATGGAEEPPEAVPLEEAIFTILSDDTNLAALVGTRIYPVEAPQAVTRPYVVFARQEVTSLLPLAGAGTHTEVDVAVMAFGDSAASAMATARAVRGALDGMHTDATIKHCRLIDRQQTAVGEPQADPVLIADAQLFRMLSLAA